MIEFKERIDNLRELLVHENHLPAIGKYFFDALAEDRAFIQNGKVVKNPMLKKILRKACDDFISKDQQMTKLLMIQLKGYPFLHGAFFIGPHLSNFFYYEELKKGMIMIVRSMSSGGTSFIRFTGTVIPGKGLTLAPGSTTVQ